MRLLVAMLCVLTYVLLGLSVAHAPLGTFDRIVETALFGHGVALAWVLTVSGTLPVYLSLAMVLGVFALMRRAWRSRVAFSLALTPLTWCASDLGKAYFGRARPPHWLMHHETSPSYASGHAALALVSYGLWAWFLWRSDLSPVVRYGATGFLIAWTLGVGWSRIVLGAHYPTDVIGGYLLGGAVWMVLRELRFRKSDLDRV